MPPASCQTCRFFARTDAVSGACRRRAPAVSPRAPDGHAGRFGAYPLVALGGWCGEHEPRPQKATPANHVTPS